VLFYIIKISTWINTMHGMYMTFSISVFDIKLVMFINNFDAAKYYYYYLLTFIKMKK